MARDQHRKNSLSEVAKKFWKQILGVLAVIGVAVTITIAISIDFIHIGDVNVHTTISQVDNRETRTGASQSSPDNIQQATIQLEGLEPCTTYEFQASTDPNFKDAETITFTTECEE